MQTNHSTMNQAFKSIFKGTSDGMQQCIDNCLECHRVCEQIIPYCLEKGGVHSERAHIQLLSNCVDICRTSAHFMMWGSELHTKTCELCAEVCMMCAEDCERMDDDELMMMCAEACRQCAESCRQMSSH
jgi:hypothetical protein